MSFANTQLLLPDICGNSHPQNITYTISRYFADTMPGKTTFRTCIHTERQSRRNVLMRQFLINCISLLDQLTFMSKSQILDYITIKKYLKKPVHDKTSKCYVNNSNSNTYLPLRIFSSVWYFKILQK